MYLKIRNIIGGEMKFREIANARNQQADQTK